MGWAVSNEKRADIVRHMQAGEKQADVAKWMFVSAKTVKRIWNKFKATGCFEPEPKNSGRKPLVTDETMGQVLAKIKDAPDITLLELVEGLGLPISQVALSKRLKAQGLTYKKKRSIPKSGRGQTLQQQGPPGGRGKAE